MGYKWIDALKKQGKSLEFARYPEYKRPMSTEAAYYRQIFDSLFPYNTMATTVPYDPTSTACSTGTAAKWMGNSLESDPSGRSIGGVHMNKMNSVKTMSDL